MAQQGQKAVKSGQGDFGAILSGWERGILRDATLLRMTLETACCEASSG